MKGSKHDKAPSEPGQVFILRIRLTFLLLFLICWIYLMWVMDRPGGEVSAQQMTLFAGSFFYMFISVQFIAVVHTPPGTANLVAVAIDESGWRDVLGTVAGDDTVLVISASASACRQVVVCLPRWIPTATASSQRPRSSPPARCFSSWTATAMAN